MPDLTTKIAEQAVWIEFAKHFKNQDTVLAYLKEILEFENVRMTEMCIRDRYTTGREMMEGLAGLSEKYKIPVYVHCSETKREVEDCRSRTGMTPVAYMDSLGLFAHGGGLFHGVHLDDADFDIVKERGLYIVTNPASNLKLASGIAPVKRYLDMNIPVAIGTDGPASNNCLDMFREMFLTTGLQKVLCDDAEVVPALEVLKMATVNGAHAMGLPECDIIADVYKRQTGKSWKEASVI